MDITQQHRGVITIKYLLSNGHMMVRNAINTPLTEAVHSFIAELLQREDAIKESK